MQNKSVRKKRLAAYLIDFAVCLIPAVLALFLIRIPFFWTFPNHILLFVDVWMLVYITLRDYLFPNGTLGKQICKLTIIDTDTLGVPSTKQLIVKNLYINILDFPFLMFSKRSFGERITRTTVVCSSYNPDGIDPSERKKKIRERSLKKCMGIVSGITLCVFIPFTIVLSASSAQVKEQESYQVAFDYLADSSFAKELKAEENSIVLSGHNVFTSTVTEEHTDMPAHRFSFFVSGHQCHIICHPNGGVWYVCNLCTAIE